MGFDINNFNESINQYGVLKNNAFDIQFSPPAIFANVSIGNTASSSLTSLINMRGSEANLPGVALLTADIQRYGFGPLQKFPVNAAFTDSSLTFIADRQSFIYTFWYEWFNGIFDFSGTSGASQQATYLTQYKANYVVDMNITMYDQFGANTVQAVLYECYPVTFNDTRLNWEDNDSIMKIVIGITFRDWALT